MTNYLPVLAWFGFLLGLAAVMLALTTWLGPKRTNPEKELPFETGNRPSPGSPRERLPIHFYVVAILFVVFDIEIAFLYPWAVKFNQWGWFGLGEMAFFIGILIVGWFYAIKRGILPWK